MSFIDTIDPADAGGAVKAMYESEGKHFGGIPDYARIFCHRPDIMTLWAQLHRGIRAQLSPQYYELATFAAAVELGSTACSVVHGKKMTKFYSPEYVVAIARGETWHGFFPLEKGIVALARKVARDATTVKRQDIQLLQKGGLSDGEIFDIVATAAGRAFFTKLVEGLGVRHGGGKASLEQLVRKEIMLPWQER